MTVDGDQSREQFKKLLSYFVIEQFLLPSTGKACRSQFWGLVDDLPKVNTINWPQAVLDDIHEKLMLLKAKLNDPSNDAKASLYFGACAPVLEAMLYERIPSLRPEEFTEEPPIIQKYKGRRKVDRLSVLTSGDINKCLCSRPSGSYIIESLTKQRISHRDQRGWRGRMFSHRMKLVMRILIIRRRNCLLTIVKNRKRSQMRGQVIWMKYQELLAVLMQTSLWRLILRKKLKQKLIQLRNRICLQLTWESQCPQSKIK
ncbi:hypothetical protein ACS0TY_000352 [Phlomoides rotata]